MKINLFLTMAVIICLSPKLVHSSDVSNIQYPMFKGVERVFVLMDYNIAEVDINKLPSVLNPKSITQRILDAYLQRFSSKDCTIFFKKYKGTAKPYECNDQPVILVSPEDYTNFLDGRATSFATKDELHDSGSLIVFFSVSLVKDFHWRDASTEVPHGNVVHFLYRPNTELPFSSVISRPSAFPLTLSKEKTIEFLDYKILQKIK